MFVLGDRGGVAVGAAATAAALSPEARTYKGIGEQGISTVLK